MYSFDSRIRYSEIEESGALSIQSLIDYFQDCSTFQSEDLNLGVETLHKIKRVWVVSAWQIIIHELPRLCDYVKICTCPYDFKGFMGFRNFWMVNEEGKRIAEANSIWTYLDTESGTPVKVTEDMMEAFKREPKLDMEYAPRKIALPKEMEAGEPIEIHRQHLDTNHHVNNGQYIKLAMDAVELKEMVHQLRVEYKKQVLLGEVLTPYIGETEGKTVVVLRDRENKDCCVVEFSK